MESIEYGDGDSSFHTLAQLAILIATVVSLGMETLLLFVILLKSPPCMRSYRYFLALSTVGVCIRNGK